MIDPEELVEIIKTRKKDIEYNEQTGKGLSDAMILSFVDEVGQAIKNYCMIPEIPNALKYVWIDMATDLCMYNAEINYRPVDPTDGVDVSDLSQIKVGDTQVYYGDKYRSNIRSRILQAHEINVDTITLNYKEQLNRFRRIW